MTVVGERLKQTVQEIAGPTKAKNSLDWMFQVTLTVGGSAVAGVVDVPLADVDWLKGLAVEKSMDARDVVREFLDRVVGSDEPASGVWRLTLSRDEYLYRKI